MSRPKRRCSSQRRMRPPGLEAFERWRDKRTVIYSYKQRHEAAFDAASEALFQANEKA